MSHQSHRLTALAALMLVSFVSPGHAQSVAPVPCLTEQALLFHALDREALTPRFLPADVTPADDNPPAESPEDILNGVSPPAAPAVASASAAAAAPANANPNAWPVQAEAQPVTSTAAPTAAPTAAQSTASAESPEDILNGVPPPAPSAASAAPADAQASDVPAAPAPAARPAPPVNADTNAWPVQAAQSVQPPQPATQAPVAAAPADQENEFSAFLLDAACLRAAVAPKPSRVEQNFQYALHGPLLTNGQRGLPRLQVQRSAVPGEGRVGVQLLDDPSWKFNVGVNNTGMYSSGKMQSTAGLFFNNPLGMDGTLNAVVSQDLQNARNDPTTRALVTNYTLPWGNDWTFGVAGSTNVSNQQTGDLSSATHGVEWRVNRVLDQSHGTETGLLFRVSRSMSEDSDQQRSGDTVTQIGLTHRRYLGVARLDFTLMQQISAPGFGQVAGGPSWSYRFGSVSANLSVPF